MSKLSSYLTLWKNMFSECKYLATALIVSCIFFFLNATIVQWNYLFTGNFFKIISVGFYYIVPAAIFYSTIIISALTGILISLIFYKFELLKSGEHTNIGFSAGFGIALGLLVPGCAPCGIGLATVIGISGSIASLPFKGIEISIVAIVLLGLSIVMITRSFLECTNLRKKKK